MSLQHRLLQLISQATATEFIIIEQFRETEETVPELAELQNVRERATTYYIRLYRLLLQIAETQPVAAATLNLLTRSIEEAQAIADAGEASTQEVKRN